jgi:cysteine desulfurase/selenocysteine lyase
MERLGTAATTRASFYLYNTFAEVDALVAAVDKAKQVFKV